jgi:hypothetical protein
MLSEIWEAISALIIPLGTIGIFIILGLAFFHPTLEAPAAILLLTSLTILMDSVWVASFLLLIAFTLGFSVFYWLVHILDRRSQYWLHKVPLTKKALLWLDAQPVWKHVVIIGMPLVYTYPLRVAFTLNHKNFWRYFFLTLGQYLVLTLGNLLIYFGMMQLIFFQAPWWVITLILFVIALLIYAIKSKPILT